MNEQQLLEEMITYRRHLHIYPELGGEENQTQQYIINKLGKWGYTPVKFETSVICDLIVDSKYDTIALRADIDGLAIPEASGVKYRSQHQGVMHACGHDGHTAILLGVASYLITIKDQLKVNVRYIFQQDEEQTGGADKICRAGFLDGISQVFGLHIDVTLPVGTIGVKYGQMNAGGDDFEIIVQGKQAHGAAPQLGIDALTASAQIITAAQSIVSRMVGPTDSTVITIGKINGGTTPNTICDRVVLEGTIRNLDVKLKEQTVAQFFKQAQMIGEAMNCQVTVNHIPSYLPLINDQQSTDYIVKNATELGINCQWLQEPSLGLEDFSYYLFRVPGAFFRLGSAIEGKPTRAHSDTFDFDENCLLVGAKLQIANCVNYRGECDED